LYDHYIPVALISFAAGLVQGLSGFGSALVAMPLLLLFMPARVAAPFCILMGLVITLQLGIGLKKHLDFRKIALRLWRPLIVISTKLAKRLMA
jgi:uncharacterized membrane protein YfcA